MKAHRSHSPDWECACPRNLLRFVNRGWSDRLPLFTEDRLRRSFEIRSKFANASSIAMFRTPADKNRLRAPASTGTLCPRMLRFTPILLFLILATRALAVDEWGILKYEGRDYVSIAILANFINSGPSRNPAAI